MTTLNCQDRNTGKALTVTVAKTGCRRDVIDYVARAYPNLHIVSFA